jgi:hypothetical protein
MAYKDFIEKFVKSSSLSEKDSKLLALEMESDFYAKEKDLILNNETDIMKKIEEDFGDKDKLAEQMFLAHHKYLNIPILGPLLYFKTIRWIILIIVLYPLNELCANLIGGLFYFNQTFGSESPFSLNNIVYMLGFIIPFLPVIFLFLKSKASNKDIILSLLLSVVIIALIIFFFLMGPINNYSTFSLESLLIRFVLLTSPYLFFILITLVLKKILKR